MNTSNIILEANLEAIYYLHGSVRHGVETTEQYKNWLARLTEGAYVTFQEFLKPSPSANSIFTYPQETWRFRRGQFSQGSFSLLGSTTIPVSEDGAAALKGNPFPGRIVPDFLPRYSKKDDLVALSPLFEPLYWGGVYRHILHSPQLSVAISQRFPCMYHRIVERGYLTVAYDRASPEAVEQWVAESQERVRHCYSEYLEPT